MTEIGAIPTRHPRHVHRTVEVQSVNTRVVVTMLYCGQGMANVVAFYDANAAPADPPAALGLVDFGVKARKRTKNKTLATQYASAVDHVYDLLVAKEQAGLGEALDFVVVSHQDDDHWRLLGALQEKMNSRPGGLQIDYLWRGGSSWKQSSADAIKALTVAIRQVLPKAMSDFKNPKAKSQPYLWHYDDAYVRVIGANAPKAAAMKDDAARRNGTSAVLSIECGGVHVVLPGDATYQTFEFVNPILTAWLKGTGKPAVQPCRAVAVPHHGSLNTFVKGKSILAAAPGTAFVEHVKAENAVASAGFKNTYRHPRIDVMDVFAAQAKPITQHTYVGYAATSGYKKPRAVKVTKRVFTTIIDLKGTTRNYFSTFGAPVPRRVAAAPRAVQAR